MGVFVLGVFVGVVLAVVLGVGGGVGDVCVGGCLCWVWLAWLGGWGGWDVGLGCFGWGVGVVEGGWGIEISSYPCPSPNPSQIIVWEGIPSQILPKSWFGKESLPKSIPNHGLGRDPFPNLSRILPKSSFRTQPAAGGGRRAALAGSSRFLQEYKNSWKCTKSALCWSTAFRGVFAFRAPPPVRRRPRIGQK